MPDIKSKFEILYLEEVHEFLASIGPKARNKIIYNIDKSKVSIDPELFKKLTDTIWEFRTNYNGLQYRLLAFWDKTEKTETLVISTHGFIKKTDRVPENEIAKAEQSRKLYFSYKKS